MFVDGHAKRFKRIGQPNKISFRIHTTTKQTIDLPVVKYANTTLTIDGHRVTPRTSRRGTVSTQLPRGTHVLIVGYRYSSAMRVSLVITVMSWLPIIVACCKRRRQQFTKSL